MASRRQFDAVQQVKIAAHSGWLVLAVIPIMVGLAGAWMSSFGLQDRLAALLVWMTIGAILIGWAKFPAYRAGRICSWGLRTVPGPRIWVYHWGWRVFLSGLLMWLPVTGAV